ncbi:MAG: DUF1847 domain-containing protein [Proteobacteria bacterium]|nr:DUF1847 domain-containing protein [Pseudomonadota bacterium]MBU1583312.1 DUF1847 domain-containing protein [Pseudomonadota bacterium]MBU2453679.1 DUF1847 domain-containing protein [Pseudomonadota bacterium]MBU2629571.1 DUF1847 domain-containing protein [Pseudomonadota bacterium]
MTDKKKKKTSPSCASCEVEVPQRICFSDKGKGHKGCPTVTQKEVLIEANKAYEPKDVKAFAYKASLQEAQCYANRDQHPYIMQPTKTRIVETCEFALKMGYKRLGLAFCLGLSKEAKIVEEILTGYGFEVVSICCKAGNTSKESIGISDDEKIYKGTDEAMCNPIFQAKALNQEQVEFNILLGLCVGHDALFFKFSDIPTTVLAVKDRVTGHNPLAAVYQSESYYKKIRYPDIKK